VGDDSIDATAGSAQHPLPVVWRIALVNTVTAAILDGYVGKNISEICGNGFANAADNHCAHFVSHALGLAHGLTCAGMIYRAPQPGASIRCDELFNALPLRGAWASAPVLNDGLLIFTTSTGNVSAANIMSNVPRKHVGIVFGGAVYNYGNTDDKVRKEASVEDFRARMGRAYHDAAIGLYYATPQ
jgi:hypothetical protein